MASWVGVALLPSTGLCIGLRKLPVYAAFALLPPAAALILGFPPGMPLPGPVRAEANDGERRPAPLLHHLFHHPA